MSEHRISNSCASRSFASNGTHSPGFKLAIGRASFTKHYFSVRSHITQYHTHSPPLSCLSFIIIPNPHNLQTHRYWSISINWTTSTPNTDQKCLVNSITAFIHPLTPIHVTMLNHNAFFYENASTDTQPLLVQPAGPITSTADQHPVEQQLVKCKQGIWKKPNKSKIQSTIPRILVRVRQRQIVMAWNLSKRDISRQGTQPPLPISRISDWIDSQLLQNRFLCLFNYQPYFVDGERHISERLCSMEFLKAIWI